MPPFTPAIRKGDHKGQAVSTQTKADVERALAVAGISRLTFNWDVKYGSESPWNSTVIEVLGLKTVEWLQRSVPISREEAGQAPAVIQQWVNTKCREIREAATLGGDNYDQIKVGKAAKAQFERWRKKIKENRCLIVREILKNNIPLAHIVENKECGSNIKDGGPNNLPTTRCPTWRSTNLTTILHCLNKIAQSKAVHHQTITSNHQLYGRSQKLFCTFIGIKGVPRDLPRDCYNEVWWNKLSPSNKQVLSQVKPINLAEVAKNLELHCHGKTVMAGGDAGTGGSGKSMPKR
ncbi:hypothetical protein PCANC_24149 [Puccinia coronata f. sp. avenae]|uniref:Uncharacterized protein n=1 Tax=Puccinia coronata f. sp. avenae TaxID=200324 RepID=A0A2N5TXY9_9BASI|nr:hypothetical protein PCANC_24149 [Puccinia coronata f. sp. avenae]